MVGNRHCVMNVLLDGEMRSDMAPTVGASPVRGGPAPHGSPRHSPDGIGGCQRRVTWLRVTLRSFPPDRDRSTARPRNTAGCPPGRACRTTAPPTAGAQSAPSATRRRPSPLIRRSQSWSARRFGTRRGRRISRWRGSPRPRRWRRSLRASTRWPSWISFLARCWWAGGARCCGRKRWDWPIGTIARRIPSRRSSETAP